MQQEVPKALESALEQLWRAYVEENQAEGSKPETYLPADGVRRIVVAGKTFSQSGSNRWQMG